MSYMSEQALVLAKTLEKLTTLNRHQLAGHVANVDFWVDEAKHVLSVIDTYHSRFRRMRDAQKQYVGRHSTVNFDVGQVQGRELEFDDVRAVAPPKPISDEELREPRSEVVQAIRRFLLRSHREKLLEPAQVHGLFEKLGIGLEPGELDRP